jgi:hypothetical protein
MSGCTSAQWTKAGATQQDFATDSYDCEKDARQSGYYGSGLAGAINMQGFFNRCMNAHGWTLATVPSSGMSITNTAPTYTQEQWEDAKRQCRAQALAQAKADFANSFDTCMRSHNLYDGCGR